jgi:hypothetical protein
MAPVARGWARCLRCLAMVRWLSFSFSLRPIFLQLTLPQPQLAFRL